jgi:hypothetical protein
MQARLIQPRTHEISLDPHEEVEIVLCDSGFQILEYRMWSDSFAVWIKQDLNFLAMNYQDDYEIVCKRIEKKMFEMGI